jgi:hypothetical protein
MGASRPYDLAARQRWRIPWKNVVTYQCKPLMVNIASMQCTAGALQAIPGQYEALQEYSSLRLTLCGR